MQGSFLPISRLWLWGAFAGFALAGSAGCGGGELEFESESESSEEERVTIPLSADFPYEFATGVDTDSLLIFRDLHEVTLTASQAELRQHFYDPEPFGQNGRKSIQKALEDPEGDRLSIKSGLSATDVSFQLEVGEYLLDHLNLHSALLPEPENYTLGDLADVCVDDGMGGYTCSAPLCTEDGSSYSIVTGAWGCTVRSKIYSLSDYTGELYSTEPTIAGGRKQIRWSLFDPTLLSSTDAASFLRNQTRHLIPVLDDEFVEINFRDPVRLAAAFALWEDQLSDSERAELESLSDEATTDAAETEFLALSIDARFRRILPPYLRKHLGNWRSGNFPDCIATAMNSTIPRYHDLENGVWAQFSSPDLAETLALIPGVNEAEIQSEVDSTWASVVALVEMPAGTAMPDLFRAGSPVRTGSILHFAKWSEDEGKYGYTLPVHVALVLGAVVEKNAEGEDEVVDLLIAEKNLNGIYPVHTELLSNIMDRVQDPDSAEPNLILAYEYQGVAPSGIFAIPEDDSGISEAGLVVGSWENCAEKDWGSRRTAFEFRESGTFASQSTDYEVSGCPTSQGGSPSSYTSGVYSVDSQSGDVNGDSASWALSMITTYPANAEPAGDFHSFTATASWGGSTLTVTPASSTALVFERADSPPLLSCLAGDSACTEALATP